MSQNNKTITKKPEQLVVFSLGDESYGVDINEVSGIERIQAITKVPQTPDFVEGVINLRGKIIPVVNPRRIFLLPPSEQTKDTRIVVVDIGGNPIGITVDAVTEVLRISPESIEPASSMITATGDSEYLLGIVKLEDKMIILLDIDSVLSSNQSGVLNEMDTGAIEASPQKMEATVTKMQTAAQL